MQRNILACERKIVSVPWQTAFAITDKRRKSVNKTHDDHMREFLDSLDSYLREYNEELTNSKVKFRYFSVSIAAIMAVRVCHYLFDLPGYFAPTSMSIRHGLGESATLNVIWDRPGKRLILVCQARFEHKEATINLITNEHQTKSISSTPNDICDWYKEFLK